MPLKNYYQILNITQECQLSDIKRAYRTLALKYHPDKNKDSNAEQKFIEITEAYEVLRDPIKRKEYDALYNIYFPKYDGSIADEAQNDPSIDKQEYWYRYGKSKAKEYASVPFDEFSRRMLREVSIGLGYIPNIIALIITVGSGFSILSISPEIFSKSIIGGIFSLAFAASIFFLSFKLFEVAKADYIQERKLK